MNKAIAEFNRTTCYIITDSDNRQVGVIVSNESNIEITDHEEDVTKRIELAVKEHECAKSATFISEFSINSSYRPIEFSCDIKPYDGNMEIRIYTITPSFLYGKE